MVKSARQGLRQSSSDAHARAISRSRLNSGDPCHTHTYYHNEYKRPRYDSVPTIYVPSEGKAPRRLSIATLEMGMLKLPVYAQRYHSCLHTALTADLKMGASRKSLLLAVS